MGMQLPDSRIRPIERTKADPMTLAPQQLHNRDDRLAPTGRDLLYIALAGLLLHVAVFVAASACFHIPLDQYVSKGDGESYIAYARALCGEIHQLDEYHRRVFPGYPAMIALLHLAGVPVQWAALAITWCAAAAAAAMAAAFFQDRRIGWGMLILPPHYLINSSLVMSEAPLLALVLAGLLLTQRGRTIAGAMLLGAAGLIRPMACFAVLGAMATRFRSVRRLPSVGSSSPRLGALKPNVNRASPVPFPIKPASPATRWRPALLLGGVSAIVVATGIAALYFWTGDALEGTRVYANSPRAYAGRMIMWPFQALIVTPLREPTSVGKLIYIWTHVFVALAGCIILARRTYRGASTSSPRPSDADAASTTLACVWLVGNTVFVLCVGSPWGFRHFPRFMIPAMPALLWALRPILPRRWWIWLPPIAAVFVMAVLGVHDSP